MMKTKRNGGTDSIEAVNKDWKANKPKFELSKDASDVTMNKIVERFRSEQK